jgi:hypothetical protein
LDQQLTLPSRLFDKKAAEGKGGERPRWWGCGAQAPDLRGKEMADRRGWRPILFDCPKTGQKVQGILAEEAFAAGDTRYEAVTCLACSGVHFINSSTGNILGARGAAGN